MLFSVLATTTVFTVCLDYEGAGEGAESLAFPASNTICITRSFASRLVADTAWVYTSSVMRELA